MKQNTQNGNALFFILIAVVMLGLLTMILSRGGSNTEQTGDFERNSIMLGQVMRYAKSVENAVQEMRLRDISENEISFENSITSIDYTNPNCDDASDRNFPRCMIFDVGGSGLSYRNFSGANDGSDWIFTSANNVGTTARPIGTTTAGSGNDLIMLLPNIDAALCTQINRDLGVGTTGTIPAETTGIDTTEFTGSYPSASLIVLDGDPTPFELDGQAAGCFTDENASPAVTYFYQVLLAR
ncbi:MAG: hypothetical protein GW778_01025 [Alphaproteobacteria bacterium]|nr:hypothetical protein [Alphaproteobacteria bacterium]